MARAKSRPTPQQTYSAFGLTLPHDLVTLKMIPGGQYTLQDIHYGLETVPLSPEIEERLTGVELLSAYAGIFRFMYGPKPKWYKPMFLGDKVQPSPSQEQMVTPETAQLLLAQLIHRGMQMPGLLNLQRTRTHRFSTNSGDLARRLEGLNYEQNQGLAQAINPPARIGDPYDPNAGGDGILAHLYVKSITDSLLEHAARTNI